MYLDPEKAAIKAEELFATGASIVDIGGAATNPGAHKISPEEELDRIETLVSLLLPLRPDYSYSIDTYHPEIVDRLARYGRFIVNDVTTFINPDMIDVAAWYELPVIASHMPLVAEGDFEYAHELFMGPEETRAELMEQRSKMIAGGIAEENIILDPGLGFGKLMQANWELLGIVNKYTEHLEGAWMLGPSEKRMLEYTTEGLPKKGADKKDEAANRAVVGQIIRSHKLSKRRLLLRVHNPGLYQDLLPQTP